MRYVLEHYRHKPDAEHYLLIGPYDHFGAQSSTKPSMLRGYQIDSVAQFDTVEITFKWFDYVMHGAPKPSLIQGKMNLQVMGTNAWAHAESPSDISNGELRLFLSGETENSHRLLTDSPDSETRFFEQTVDFADRTGSSHNYYPSQIVREDLELTSGLSFISEPLDAPVTMAGGFSGQLMASINKRDMDITVVLYEVMPDGRAMQLSYYVGRASFVEDMTRRQLLEPGDWHPIAFDRTRMVAKQFEQGSRLLVVIDVNKAPFAQINHGTGKDVSEESIADADVPLQVKWRSDSFISIPIR